MSAPLDGPLRQAPRPGGIERARIHANLASKMFGRPAPPLRVGRYQLLDREGGGAQGDVYRALDPQLDRIVAVKVLRHVAEVASREARALARLSHPNVVNVFGCGTAAGPRLTDVSYVVTEFVHGPPLPRWLERNPSRAERIAVLAGCARGLYAAHRAGLVHGDFKPSNVMVELPATARVIDFGVATEAAAPASVRGVEGTVGYIAPERISGDVGPHNDQYALCTLATALLEPVRVSGRLRRALRRGCAPNPRDRFDDLGPIIELLTRESQRRGARWVVPTVALVGVACVAAMLGDDPRRPCGSASASRRGVWTDARRASLADHRDAHALATRADAWIEAWDEARISTCERGPEAAPDTQCLEGLLIEFDGLLETVGLARQRTTVVEALADLPRPQTCIGRRDVAVRPEDEETLRRARLQAELEGEATLLGATEGLASRLDGLDSAFAAQVLTLRAAGARAQGRRADARAMMEAAVWKAEEAKDAGRAAEISAALALRLVIDEGDVAAAQPWLRRAQAFAERSATPQDDRSVMRQRARWFRHAGRYDAARSLLDALSQDAEDLDAARIFGERCMLEEVAGNPLAAVEWCERTIDAYAEALGPDHPRTLSARQSLGAALERAGRFEEARAVLEDTIRRVEEAGEHVQMRVWNSLAIVLEQLGELDAAQRTYTRAIEALEALPDDHPESVEILELNLGTLAMKRGLFDEAESRYRRALVSVETRLGPEHPRAMSVHWGLAEVYEGRGRYAQALASIDEALRIGDETELGPGLLVQPRLTRARILIEGGLDPAAGRAEAERVLADVTAHAPELSDVVAQARAFVE